jgi:RND family efflux transporter MFP subunit
MKYYCPGSFILFLIFLAAGCKQKMKIAETGKTAIDSTAAFILQKNEVDKQISFPAELTPIERAEIFPKVTGYIGSIKVDIGDRVRKGQIIAMLEAPEMSANYSQANAEVQTARSKYLGSLDIYNRIVNASGVAGTIAAGELAKAKSQMMADSSSLQAARSKFVAYGQLKDYLIIHSPFNGTVTQRNIDQGTLAVTSNPKPLFVIENTNYLRLRIPVPEAYTAAVNKSETIEFTVDAQPDITYKANLSRKAGALNLMNRTETWEFIYANKNNELKSGMFANAHMKLSRNAPSFVVPSSAVAGNLEKRFVIRVTENKAAWIEVRSGMSLGDKLEIFGNLREGDSLLLRGSDEIKEGTAMILKFSK